MNFIGKANNMITEKMLVILVKNSCICILNLVKSLLYITLAIDIWEKQKRKGVYNEKKLKNNTDLSISFS